MTREGGERWRAMQTPAEAYAGRCRTVAQVGGICEASVGSDKTSETPESDAGFHGACRWIGCWASGSGHREDREPDARSCRSRPFRR